MTAACSLLEELAHINSLGFMDCVPLAVTRLSRVRQITSTYADWDKPNVMHEPLNQLFVLNVGIYWFIYALILSEWVSFY